MPGVVEMDLARALPVHTQSMGADLLKIMQAERATSPVEDLIRARFEDIVKALDSAPYYDLVAPTGEVYRLRHARGRKTREAAATSTTK
jgi:hypothetical protein